MADAKKLIAIVLIGLVALSGCSSGTGRHLRLTGENRTPTSAEAEQSRAAFEQTQIHPLAFHNYVNGLLYTEIGDYRSAVESFTVSLQYHPDSHPIRLALADTYYSLRNFGQAVEVLEPIEPEDADVYNLRAAAYMALGMAESAHRAYRELVNVDSTSTTAFAFLGNYYREHNDLDSVVWVYQNLARLRPENERYWQELGRLHGIRGDFASARESFETSISLRQDPTNIMSYVGLAEIYSLNNRFDSALVVYKAALEVDSNNVLINREIATTFAQMDSLEQAIPFARKVSELSPNDPTASRRLGAMYFVTDSVHLADSVFSALVMTGDRHSLNHYYLGRVAVLNENYPRAIEQFTFLTQLADTSAESWLDLGYAHRLAEEPENEILTYETGLSHMRDDESPSRLLFALAAACERNGQYDKAISTLEEIIARSPDHDQALNYLGYMLADHGERLVYAQQLIEKAVAISPDNAAYLDSYGWVFYRTGRYDQALLYLKQAVSLDNDPVIFDHLGDTFRAMGDMENAHFWWKRALELKPDDEQIKQKLGK